MWPIKIDWKRWWYVTWYGQRWFGYTYLEMRMGGDQDPIGQWYKNDHHLVKLVMGEIELDGRAK